MAQTNDQKHLLIDHLLFPFIIMIVGQLVSCFDHVSGGFVSVTSGRIITVWNDDDRVVLFLFVIIIFYSTRDLILRPGNGISYHHSSFKSAAKRRQEHELLIGRLNDR